MAYTPKLLLLVSVLLFSIVSCSQYRNYKTTIEKYWSSLDSSGFSVYLGTTIEKQKVFAKYITVDVETDDVASVPGIDAADDSQVGGVLNDLGQVLSSERLAAEKMNSPDPSLLQ